MIGNVIKIGDLKIRRLEKRGWRDERCPHKNTTWDANGEIVTCDDCKMQVSAWWLLHMFTAEYERALADLEHRERALADARRQNLHLIAAKKVEAAWRSKGMVPACPHCDRGILPEDGLGSTNVNRAIELARRRHDPGNKPGRPIPET